MDKVYMCIDLKSFYASVECVERNLDPLKTNLVVADDKRTDKTVCLAVTPSLKQYGIGGRSRLYEVKDKVYQVNRERKKEIRSSFMGKSYNDDELKNNKYLELDFIIAVPRMKYYMKYSNWIYEIYLKYLSGEDIFAYSIDEVFCDITNYLKMYKKTPKEIATMIVKDICKTTGITATVGIGTNIFLAKVAMDIVAKHCDADENGARIAILDEKSYREKLWGYRPLSSFWRIGKKIAEKLEKNGMYTMGDIALKSIEDENFLFKLFGINAELIIDHAWGYEPCTIQDVKKYKPLSTSLSSSQVLYLPYNYLKARLIVMEMMELLSLDMVKKKVVSDKIVLDIGYDTLNLVNIDGIEFNGEIVKDNYGRKVPKPSHGTVNLNYMTSSTDILTQNVIKLYERIINQKLLIRKITITICNLEDEETIKKGKIYHQVNLFSDFEKEKQINENERLNEERERKVQKAILSIKDKYGNNSIIKGMNLMNGGTTIERNKQVGGHRG